MRKTNRETHRQLREYGHSDTVISVLDLARQLSDRTRDLAPLLRALAVEPVHIRLLGPNSTLGYSTDGQRRYVHAFTSVPRLVASMDAEDEQLSMQQVPLPQLAAQLPESTGILLDVGSPMQRPIEPEHLREIRAMAAGIATRCALHAVEGEDLHVVPGPDSLMPLDERVRAIVAEHAGPDAAATLARAMARLDGVGGRDWPVYFLDTGTTSADAASAIRDQVGPSVLVVHGENNGSLPDALTGARNRAVLLAGLS